MENKQEMAQALDDEQLDQVSGGSGDNVKICPFCGETYDVKDYRVFSHHVVHCPKAPKIQVIG